MPRKYEMVKRRDQVEQTRRRITKATYELHSTIGPAHATMARIAERAGLPRQTVYRTFASQLDLFRSCIAFGLELHPMPDPTKWESVPERRERLRLGLRQLYGWFEQEEAVLTNSMRDGGLFPEAEAAMQPVAEIFQRMHEILASGWEVTHAASLIGLAIDFGIWKKLRREQQMQSRAIAEFWTGLVECRPAS